MGNGFQKIKILKWVGLLVVFLVLPVSLWAKGTAGVANTVHNLSATNPMGAYVSNVDEICVFCHTPHGGSLSGPLWNHSLPGAGSFTHYNSATITLSSLPGMTATRTVNDESLLCMACHDGSVALSHLLNPPNSTTDGGPVAIAGFLGDDEIIDLFGMPGPRIGGAPGNSMGTGDLSDDHPISFSYSAVQSQLIYNGGARDGELRDVATATSWAGEGVRFFGTDDRLECSSCHDPHVDYDDLLSGSADPAYKPFLIMPNTGSNLCLACHNK